MEEIIHNNFKETENILEKQDKVEAIEFSEWTKEKSKLKYETQLPDFPIYNNFVYWCDLGINIGSEQNKRRPVIIVRTENKSAICTIIPLTSERVNDKLWYHIDLENENSTALVEQIRTISKIRIINPFRKKGKMISISQKDWNSINSELSRLYQLRELKKD